MMMMMMHRHIKQYSKSLVESGGIKNGLSSVLLPLKSLKGFVERSMVVSDVGVGGVSSASAAMGSRRFFNSGALMKRDMFRTGDIPNLFRGRQTGGCVGSFIPHQCNKSHMLPYFARALASSSASQSSGQTPRQEPAEKSKECQIKRSYELQREKCDEISSTEVSLNQFPGLMVHGNVEDSKTRRLLRLNPDTGYFEEEQDVSAAASNHHGHCDLQVPNGHVCRGSAYGWLFVTDDNLDMKLLNPFSGTEIQLPPVKTLPLSEHEKLHLSKWFVAKAVFSANPSIEPRPVVLVIYGLNMPKLAFCKPGDKGWTLLDFPKASFHIDAIYHKGQFYVLGYPGSVVAFDIGRRIDDDDHSVKTVIVAAYSGKKAYMRDWYLVVLDGELVKFELRQACFCDSCIDRSRHRLECERNRDGDTTDETYCEWNRDENYYEQKMEGGTYVDEESDDDDGKKESWNEMDGDTYVGEESDDDDGINDGKKESWNEMDGDTYVGEESVDDDGKKESWNEMNGDTYVGEESDDDDGIKDGKKQSWINEKYPCIEMRLPRLTYSIKIRRFDASENEWVKVESLGDKAVFLGYNTTFALSASDYPAGICIPDSVYYSYGAGGSEYTEMCCYDVGIYNVKNKSVKNLYPPMDDVVDEASDQFIRPAPIWIVNPVSADTDADR